MDGTTSGFKGEINGFFSNVTADSIELDVTGLSAAFVKENPEVGKPSYHFTCYGGIIQGNQKSGGGVNNDVDGYVFGASVTPSFILTDRYTGLRPSVFIGADARYGKLTTYYFDNTSSNFNSWDFTHLGNPFSGLFLPEKRDTVQIGVHTGVSLDFRFNRFSVSPFFMAQVVNGWTDWKQQYVKEGRTNSTITLQAAGIEFHLIHPGLSILTMAQLAQEKDEEDAVVYTVMAGVSF